MFHVCIALVSSTSSSTISSNAYIAAAGVESDAPLDIDDADETRDNERVDENETCDNERVGEVGDETRVECLRFFDIDFDRILDLEPLRGDLAGTCFFRARFFRALMTRMDLTASMAEI